VYEPSLIYSITGYFNKPAYIVVMAARESGMLLTPTWAQQFLAFSSGVVIF
jgi:hypothetical protein